MDFTLVYFPVPDNAENIVKSFICFAAVSFPTDKIWWEQGSKISSELLTGDTFEMHSAVHLELIWSQSRYIWIQAIRPEHGLCSVLVDISIHAEHTALLLLLLLPETNIIKSALFASFPPRPMISWPGYCVTSAAVRTNTTSLQNVLEGLFSQSTANMEKVMQMMCIQWYNVFTTVTLPGPISSFLHSFIHLFFCLITFSGLTVQFQCRDCSFSDYDPEMIMLHIKNV